MKGKVVRLVSDKGFGFIKDVTGEDEYFFHRSAVKNGDFSEVKQGQEVDFEGTHGPKGLWAEEVYL